MKTKSNNQDSVADHKHDKATLINGYSYINHKVRVKLNLTCSEYVMMELIEKAELARKILTDELVYKKTGFNDKARWIIINNLIEKGMILNAFDGVTTTTDKWKNAFGNYQVEFKKFWFKNGRVFFPGSKKKTLVLFRKVRKGHGLDYLIYQRDQYDRYLDLVHKTGFNRQKMVGERWLDPEDEYFKTDWKKMADEIEMKLIKEGKIKEKISKFSKRSLTKEEVLTEEERRKQYEQDSNE